MSYTEARNHFETGRLNTVDKGVIETLDGRKHLCEEITVTTPLNHKVKVRMKNLGDDVWDTTLVYVRQPHRVGKFKGWDHVIQAATKKAIEIADPPISVANGILLRSGEFQRFVTGVVRKVGCRPRDGTPVK